MYLLIGAFLEKYSVGPQVFQSGTVFTDFFLLFFSDCVRF